MERPGGSAVLLGVKARDFQGASFLSCLAIMKAKLFLPDQIPKPFALNPRPSCRSRMSRRWTLREHRKGGTGQAEWVPKMKRMAKKAARMLEGKAAVATTKAEGPGVEMEADAKARST